MAETIHELAVAISPEGAKETQEALDSTTQSFEEATDEVQQQAETMDEFSSKFEGAMGVVVAGLAVASAGLLSQIPIIGDVAAGLFAVIDSIALKIDSVLRPALSPVSNFLFDIAAAIDEAEGPLGTFIGVIGTVGVAIGSFAAALAGAGAILAQFGIGGGVIATVIGGFTTLASIAVTVGSAIAGVIGVVIGGFTTLASIAVTVATVIAGAIATVVGALSLPIVALAALVAAVVGFAAAYITNWNGVRDKTNAVIGKILGFLKGFASQGFMLISNFVIEAVRLFDRFKAIIVTTFETAFALVTNAAKAGMNTVLGTVEAGVNKAIKALNKLPKVNIGQVSLGRFDVASRGQITSRANDRLASRIEAADRRASERRRTARERNPFAERQEVVVSFSPKDFEKFLEAKINQGPETRGRTT